MIIILWQRNQLELDMDEKISAPPRGIHAKCLNDAIHVPEVPVQECQDHNTQHIESTQPQQVKNMI